MREGVNSIGNSLNKLHDILFLAAAAGAAAAAVAAAAAFFGNHGIIHTNLQKPVRVRDRKAPTAASLDELREGIRHAWDPGPNFFLIRAFH